MAETANQVVTYQGRPVTTYFFSTSGGRTENVENSLGGTPQPWLKLRRGSLRRRLAAPPLEHEDDASAPPGAKLSGLVKGSFRGIKVIKRGASPRVVAAQVVGIARAHPRQRRHPARPLRPLRHVGVLHVDLHQEGASRPKKAPVETPPQPAAGEGTGGVTPSSRMTRFRAIGSVAGTVIPAHDGEGVEIQVRRAGSWHTVVTARVRDGAYRAAVTQPGVYRARFRGETGPL